MNRSSIVVTALAGAAVLSFAQFAAAVPTQSRIDYSAAMDRASVVYKDARAKCDSLAGHGKDMCVVEAKAGEKRAMAVAEAHYQGTLKAATASRIADADADLMVAKVACDAKTGQEKNVCVKQAQATQVKLVAEAKANKTSIDARADAREETREAQYKVAIAKCDALAGPEKEACTSSAKSAHGN
jgi:hypothetical protein